MHVTLVYVQVKPENVNDFIEASCENAEASVQERGNVRFDVLQSSDDPCRFILYEAYETSEDAAVHKGTPHYLRWREMVADWMAAPRQGIAYKSQFP